MNKSDYRKLIEEASKKKLRITKELERRTRQMYKEVSKDLEKRLLKANKNSLNERWLYDYKKQLEREIDAITKSLYKSTKEKMVDVIEEANNPQLSLFNSISDKYSLDLKPTFSSMFSRVNKEVIEEMLSGSVYRDNKGLSSRLWSDNKLMKKDIQTIIGEGLASKKSAVDLAKDLEDYLNVGQAKNFDLSKVYPLSRKQVEYNSLRLARTSINHSYQMATKRVCKDNPFVSGILWQSALQHGRTCELCRERHGRVYKADEIELDHPNGLCTMIPDIPMSFEEIGSTLRDYLDDTPTKYTKDIDEWMRNN